jgi:hypothetical protein
MKKLSTLAILASLSLVSFNVANAASSNFQSVNCKEKGACQNNAECKKQKQCNKKKCSQECKERKKALKKEAMEACKNSADVKSCMKEYKAKKKAEWKIKKQEMVSEINQTK